MKPIVEKHRRNEPLSMTEIIEPQTRLTVIVPIRWADEREDAVERLSFLLHDTHRPADVEVLVVDDGSTLQRSAAIRAACLQIGLSYCRIDSETDVFSIGRARNVGTQAARGEFVMFQDADLMPYPGFYREVLDEVEIQGLSEHAERFLMFGVIYLSEQATAEYFETPAQRRRNKFIQHFLEGDAQRIEKFSTGTSVTVWNRGYFLATGGNDPDFEGWGYEDIEYMCRAIRRAKRFPMPEEFSLDYRNFQSITEYRGWKSIYRLFGDMTFQKGMVLFHAWHPVEDRSAYAKAKERNRKLFERKLRDFKERGEEPAPLAMPERGRSLIFRTNPWVYNRWVAPAFGDITVVDESLFTPESFLAFVRERAIDRVVFHNPYANEQMLALYRAVRDNGIAFLVCERGALPDSVFFDACGFNGESTSYDEQHWRRQLGEGEQQAVADYIRDLKCNGSALEEQPERLGPRALRKQLKLSPSVKVLFVPLQRPSDTVISYLCGPIGSYDGFLQLVRRLTHTLPPDWVIVAKRHPLEVQSPDLPGVLFADEHNVNDLLELCEAVLLINSGVGVMAMVYDKPVLYAGQAFYGHDGIAQQVVTHDDVLRAVESFRPDRDAVRAFLHYLVFEFYSFARFTTRRVAWTDGALMTATTGIDYRVARVPGCRPLRMEWREQIEVSEASVLFDRYRGADGQVCRQPQRSAAGKPVAAKPAAKVVSSAPVAPGGTRPQALRKLKKLRENPVMFLRDSRFGLLRAIGTSLIKS
jgi:predicted glycosyltransferase involved in capsule biosynthesis